MTARANASLVLHAVSAETATGRAARRAAEDVLRLENVRAAAERVARHSRSKWARTLRAALDVATQ